MQGQHFVFNSICLYVRTYIHTHGPSVIPFTMDTIYSINLILRTWLALWQIVSCCRKCRFALCGRVTELKVNHITYVVRKGQYCLETWICNTVVDMLHSLSLHSEAVAVFRTMPQIVPLFHSPLLTRHTSLGLPRAIFHHLHLLVWCKGLSSGLSSVLPRTDQRVSGYH